MRLTFYTQMVRCATSRCGNVPPPADVLNADAIIPSEISKNYNTSWIQIKILTTLPFSFWVWFQVSWQNFKIPQIQSVDWNWIENLNVYYHAPQETYKLKTESNLRLKWKQYACFRFPFSALGNQKLKKEKWQCKRDLDLNWTFVSSCL